MYFKDVLMGIPKKHLLGIGMAVIHTAGQQYLAVCSGLDQRSN